MDTPGCMVHGVTEERVWGGIRVWGANKPEKRDSSLISN